MKYYGIDICVQDDNIILHQFNHEQKTSNEIKIHKTQFNNLIKSLYEFNSYINGKPKGKDKEKYSAQFLEFYQNYPLKKSKEAAYKAYVRTLQDKNVSHDTLMEGVQKLNIAIQEGLQDPDYIKHPPTWLNQGCWEDEYDHLLSNRFNPFEKMRKEMGGDNANN